MLEEYRSELEEELAGVKEEIEQMRKAESE